MSLAALRKMHDLGLTLEQAIEVMEAMGAAPVRSSGAERQARYRARKTETVASDVTRDVTETVTPGDAPPSPLSLSPQTPLSHTPLPGEITTPARKGPTKIDLARGFPAFWAAYPKHVGKDAATKALAKAMTRIDGDEPLAVILAGIERALPGWTDPQFIPHPATWLNQGRWQDEPPNITPLRPRNDRPDKFTSRHDNYDASWSGSEQAAGLLAARRAL